jgi:hypothetical protein
MSLRFHLDESVDYAVGRGLALRGIDVSTSTEAGLRGTTDDEQLAYALQAGRVLVTHDRDFLRIAAVTIAHAGIAYCPQGYRSIGHIILRLVYLSRTNESEDLHGRVEYL